MMRKRVIQAGIGSLLLAALAVFGCAEPNSPGSDNVGNTGTVLRVYDIVPADGAGLEGPGVDVALSFCLDGTTEDTGLFDVFATLTLENDSPGLGTAQNANITITSYEVQYIFVGGNPGAVNVPLPTHKAHLSIVVVRGGAVSQDILLLPVTHKFLYTGGGGNVGVVTIYEAKITFYGVNEFGDEVKGTGWTYLEFLDWATC